MSIQKSTPQVVIDRQRLKVTFDGEELPFFYAEAGPRSAPYEEGLSVVWLPILVESVEDLPADDTRRCAPGLWREEWPDAYRDVEPLICHFCQSPATRRVRERESGEALDVCGPHTWTAFS